ncbi:MAG: HAD family hydrolase [Acidobacteria bacterium]|nr:MAG: HAD family hydrolase [Acidobacteriota bacterium]
MSGVMQGKTASHLRYEGVVFDLDGTLVDSYAAITECYNHACTSLGQPAVSPETVRGLVGHGLESLMEDAVGPAQVVRAVALFRERYDVICEERTTLLPGVAGTLPRLAAGGLRLGVATNKPTRFAVRILRALGLMPPVRAVLGPGEGIPPKPRPEMLLKVLADLGVSRRQALYVGDMEIDIETARRADVDVWVVPTGSCSRSQLMAASPDVLLGEFADLQRLLGVRAAAGTDRS